MTKQMRKLLKQLPAVMAALLFVVVSAYAAKKPKHNRQLNAPAVKVRQESKETPSQSSKSSDIQEKKKSLTPSSDGKSPAAKDRQNTPAPAVAPPATTHPQRGAATPAAQSPVEVAARRPAPEEATGGWTTIPPPGFTPKYKWYRSNLERHWEKHQLEFPEFNSEQEYSIAALYFFEHPPKGTLAKSSRDGDRMLYHQDSNTFGVMTSDGTIKTLFRPSAGINYWRRQ